MTDTPVPLHRRNYQPGHAGPMDGVRVLDLSRLFAGNALTEMLGDYGAKVIKVEPPEGDTLRAWKTESVSTHWKIYARHNKSLCLGLRDPRAIDIIRRLIPSVHIFVESFQLGVLEPRTGSRSTNSAPRNAYRCKDGAYVGRSGSIQKMAVRLFRSPTTPMPR